MDYIERVVDKELDALMAGAPAVFIEGAKWVGKTASAAQRAKTVHALDNPLQAQLADADPQRLTQGEAPVLVDEWQRFPPSWDIVRRAVDTDHSPGRFLLTGSAVPPDSPTHSGAGRILTTRMRPFSLTERGLAQPTVSLTELFSGRRNPVSGHSPVDLETYAQEIVRSGFPALHDISDERVRRGQLDGYVRRIVERDFVEQGHRVRRPAVLTRWMRAYAAATGTTASYEAIRDAASSGQSTPTRATVIPYRDTLESLWIIDEVPAWNPAQRKLKELGERPKHHLVDPALAARLLNASADALLEGRSTDAPAPRNGLLLGHLFESLVTQSTRVYAQHCEARLHHLRTHRGEREVDLIAVRHDGRAVALEVKLSPMVDDGDVRHLHWLHDKLGEDLADMAVITTGPEAYRRRDGVAVIPAALLGP